ncbi:hypothetical protein K3F44_10025 [Pseudomonas sp. S07E 245]|uniref:hypothetical protein n=1 Tax=unclassified Pseudomonas TaxID=196821 RepID=UPI001C7382AF|nr:hypothetical protein [Pseudomonas sp. S07E 245]QYX54601.1 hypothetical protein K3F44_10025 [Pseudomonas sp. S07E 245]
MSNNQMVIVPREQLARVREWIESARDGVLYPIARDFDGVVGRNAEGLGQGTPELLDLIDGLLAAKPAEQHQVAPELTDDLREILGRPNFTCHFIAKALRVMGHSIAHKSEDEQAVVIHWLLGIYLKHGPDWRQRAAAELEEASQSLNT